MSQEEGAAFTCMLLIIAIVAFIFGFVLLIVGIRYISLAGKVKIRYDDAELEGPVAFLIIAVAIAIIGALLYSPFYAYYYFSDKYSVDLDNPVKAISLSEIKVAYANDTHSKI